MASKRKKGARPSPGRDEEAQATVPKVPEKLASPFKDALSTLKKQLAEQERTAAAAKQADKAVVVRPGTQAGPRGGHASGLPRPGKRGAAAQRAADEQSALSLAMQGVTPLADQRAQRVTPGTPRIATRTRALAPFASEDESDARKRLDQLVTADVSFQIERDQDYVSGLRRGAQSRLLRELARRPRANQTLDLHGMNQREAREAVLAFVRKAHKDGLDVLCVVHGKGHHSEGGQGVLRDAVVEALTETPAALRVLAFVSAPEPLGGSGALLIELKH